MTSGGDLNSSRILVMRGVKKNFGATTALDGVDLAVAAGEVHALIGENGAGKSTLMKILSGALGPDAGEMKLDGRVYAPRNPQEARESGVAMIYQELSLAPHLSVADNIMLGREPTRYGLVSHRRSRRTAEEALARLGHPEIGASVLVGSLPVAAQQVVEIARGLAFGCRVLVLDEPTSALTREDVERLFAVIARLKADGYAIVYISHFLEEIQQVADRFTVLRDGRVAGGGGAAETSISEMAALMIGRELNEMYPHHDRRPGEAILEVSGLAGAVKPESADFTLHRGEVLGIAGLVGAGRTELIRAIFGLDPVKRGRIRLGVHLGPSSPHRRWRQGAGFLSEDRKGEGLALGMSVADNLTLSKLEGLGPLNLIFPGRRLSQARRWIGELDVRCRHPDQPVSDLSGGNQQKIALARLLYHDVDALILDEPTRGIDVASKAQIYQLIDRLAAGDPNSGAGPKAVLMISSYMPELIGVCDRIAVMSRGRLGAARPAGEWDEHGLMLEAAGLGGEG